MYMMVVMNVRVYVMVVMMHECEGVHDGDDA